MLNGRRFVGDGNLNFVPTSLVERVEVVTGGASAAYGSGAVAGVVNLILKDDLEGLSVGASTGVSSRGDGQRLSLDGSFGTSFADGNGHFMIGAEYVDDKGILDRNSRPNLGSAGIVRVNPTSATDLSTVLVRDVNFGNMARPGLITTGVLAGQVFNNDGTVRPFRGGTQLGAARFNSQMIGGTDGVGLYDDVGASTPFKRFNAYARASYDVGRATLWADATYGQTTSNANFLPDLRRRPADDPVDQSLLVARGPRAARGRRSDELHVGQAVRRRLFIAVRRIPRQQRRRDRHRRQFRQRLEVQRPLQPRRSYQNQQASKTPRSTANFTKALNAVSSGGQIVCAVNADAITTNDDPACRRSTRSAQLNASEEAVDYVTGTQATNSIQQAQIRPAFELQGDLFSLWAGRVTVAVGAEARWEKQATTARRSYVRAVSALPVFTASDIAGQV